MTHQWLCGRARTCNAWMFYHRSTAIRRTRRDFAAAGHPHCREVLAAGGPAAIGLVETAARLLGVLAANAHTICTAGNVAIGLGVYPLAAMLNHDCWCVLHLRQVSAPAFGKCLASGSYRCVCRRTLILEAFHALVRRSISPSFEGHAPIRCVCARLIALACRPNCVHMFVKGALHVRALRQISAGEELCIPYTEIAAPSPERRRELMNGHRIELPEVRVW